jgi:hypothetical protein
MVQTPKQTSGKVPDLNAININRLSQRYNAVPDTVNAGGKDMHLVPQRNQSPAQAVHRINRPAIAGGGQITGNDVQNPQNQYLAANLFMYFGKINLTTAANTKKIISIPPNSLTECISN